MTSWTIWNLDATTGKSESLSGTAVAHVALDAALDVAPAGRHSRPGVRRHRGKRPHPRRRHVSKAGHARDNGNSCHNTNKIEDRGCRVMDVSANQAHGSAVSAIGHAQVARCAQLFVSIAIVVANLVILKVCASAPCINQMGSNRLCGLSGNRQISLRDRAGMSNHILQSKIMGTSQVCFIRNLNLNSKHNWLKTILLMTMHAMMMIPFQKFYCLTHGAMITQCEFKLATSEQSHSLIPARPSAVSAMLCYLKFSQNDFSTCLVMWLKSMVLEISSKIYIVKFSLIFKLIQTNSDIAFIPSTICTHWF